MSYKVIHYFTDLQDFNHPYNVGDVFPRIGMNVTEDRLKELSSNKNKQGKPLIEKIDDEVEQNDEEKKTYTKREISRMPLSELKELAKSEGLFGVDEMTGADIKKILIEKFNL